MADNTLQDLHNSSDDTKGEFIMFYHSFKIIPSLKTGESMLNFINVNFILSYRVTCLSASLGKKVVFRTANNYSPNSRHRLSSCLLAVFCYVFSQQFAYFFIGKWLKCSAMLCSLVKTSSPGLLSELFSFLAIMLHSWHHFLHITKFFQLW